MKRIIRNQEFQDHMKSTGLIIAMLVVAFVRAATGADFSANEDFDSVDSFVLAAKAFNPAKDGGALAALFTVKQSGQPGDPETRKPAIAEIITSCKLLWADQTHAFVFATAEPPLQSTKAMAGALFLLGFDHGRWKIADQIRFVATGKYAGVTAELTADAGSGYSLGQDEMPPIVTVHESQGGRGYSYQLSASYSFEAGKWKRAGPE